MSDMADLTDFPPSPLSPLAGQIHVSFHRQAAFSLL